MRYNLQGKQDMSEEEKAAIVKDESDHFKVDGLSKVDLAVPSLAIQVVSCYE